MDLSKYDTTAASQSGVFLHLRDLADEPLYDGEGENRKPVGITLLGPDSDVYKQHVKERSSEVIKMTMKQAGRKNRDAQMIEMTPERLKKQQLDLAVACTLGWSGIGDKDTPELPCTPENVRAVYEKYEFILQQVDGFIGDRQNFLKGSATN